MIRVGALVVVLRMATGAIGRRTRISRGVATDAGSGYMRPGQGEAGVVVIKSIRRAARRVTRQAGRAVVTKTVYAVVLVGRFRIRMAGRTGEFRIIRRIGMAVRALVPLSFVFAAVNGEIHPVVVESGRRPGRFAVTGGAVR